MRCDLIILGILSLAAVTALWVQNRRTMTELERLRSTIVSQEIRSKDLEVAVSSLTLRIEADGVEYARANTKLRDQLHELELLNEATTIKLDATAEETERLRKYLAEARGIYKD